jgi:hypothetical protein
MNRPAAALFLIGSCFLIPSHRTANAQSVAATREGFSLTPYLWMSSLDGRVGVGPLATNVDLSFGDILKKLKFGIMGTGAYRHGHWVLLADGVYVSLGDATAVAFRADTGRFDLTQHETIIQPMGGYTVHGDAWAVDILIGLRYWNLNTVLDVDRTRRNTTTRRELGRNWVDALGGAAAHWRVIEKVTVTAGADGGGGGSRDSWHVYGAVGVDAWRNVSLGAAYRALWVNYDRNNYLFDTDTKGFLLDATFHF